MHTHSVRLLNWEVKCILEVFCLFSKMYIICRGHSRQCATSILTTRGCTTSIPQVFIREGRGLRRMGERDFEPSDELVVMTERGRGNEHEVTVPLTQVWARFPSVITANPLKQQKKKINIF